MSLASRLGKLMPFLPVRERISLALRAKAAGEEPDPELKRLSTLEQRQEYDWYVALIIAANQELGTLLQGLEIVALDLESRLGDLELLKDAVVMLAEQEGSASPPRPVRNWRRQESIDTAVFFNEGPLRFLQRLAWPAAHVLSGVGRRL